MIIRSRNAMTVQNSTAFVTGANRGIGRAIVEGLLRSKVGRVYAAARDTAQLNDLAGEDRKDLTVVKLDLNDPETIAAAADQAADVTLLINNAGILEPGSQLTADLDSIRRDFETNYFGTLRVVRAFAPILLKNGGAIVNVLSVASFASVPSLGAYSASKAALHSLTQALRAELTPKGVAVHGVYPGPVDTEMIREVHLDKASPADVADAIVKGIDRGILSILPDDFSVSAYETWRRDPATLEEQFGRIL
jgi:short-subunit dehydrogenase